MGKHRRHSRAGLIRALWRFAASGEGPVTLMGFCRSERMASATVNYYFPRGFGSLAAAAGVRHRRSRLVMITRETLMAELHRVVGILGRFPSHSDLTRLARYCAATYTNRIGRVDAIRGAYQAWRNARGLGAAPAAGARGFCKGNRLGSRGDSIWLGEPLGFRGMLHTPTSEAGVIHLFGLLAPETGLVVESIGASFPDCRALRGGPGKRWRRIAVEFEYLASNFRAHRHDPRRCDLIVCWENDWPDCPIEVMELKGLLRKAQGQAERTTESALSRAARGAHTQPPPRRHRARPGRMASQHGSRPGKGPRRAARGSPGKPRRPAASRDDGEAVKVSRRG